MTDFSELTKPSTFGPEYRGVQACPDCGSYNVSKDVKTNKITCRDCADKKLKEAKRVDFEEKAKEKRDEDVQEIVKKRIVQGDDFDVNFLMGMKDGCG